MKVHLGCGKRKIQGWINLDMDSTLDPDVIDDVCALTSIEDGSVDIIYASHVLEHTGRWKWKSALALWAKKLKPGGILRIAVPCFPAALHWYKKTGDINAVMGLICGGQKTPWDVHYVIFDEAALTQGFVEAGLQNVGYWDWRTVEHAHVDDYSQAYLPHMRKEDGLHVSLNMEAKKPAAP